MNKTCVAIVGGGISGLSTAYELSRAALQDRLPLRILLLEAGTRWGGVIRTGRHGPFVMEGAADAFYGGGARGREAVEFCRSLGVAEELVEVSPSFRNFFILKNKKPIPFPARLNPFDPTSFFSSSLLSFSAKARLLAEFWIPRPREKDPGDESAGQFIRRRLGAAFYREAVRPLIRGVYMADPDDLSLRAAFPGLWKKEKTHGSMTRAAVAELFKKEDPGGARFFNFENGLESLIRALVRALSFCELRTSAPVRRLGKDGSAHCLFLENGEILRADKIGLAMTAPDAASLLRDVDTALSRDLAEIPYDSALTFNFIFKEEDLPPGIPGPGFFVPAQGEVYPFSSLKGFEPVPGGKFRRLRVFISEAMLPGVFSEEDGKVEKKILRALRELFGICAAPDCVKAERYLKALPRYGVGHDQRIAGIEAGLRRNPGLFLTGNGFRGFGITDCIHAAKLTARALREGVQ